MNKVLSVIFSLMFLTLLCGCAKENVTDDYDGILYKLRLEMPLEKVTALNSTDLYQEGDCVWTVSNDTHLARLKDRIPSENLYYYTDDSLISFYFRESEDNPEELVLRAFSEELYCKTDRKTGRKFYDDLIQVYANKYGAIENSYKTYCTGVDGIDAELHYNTCMTFLTYEITIDMIETYDTVNDIDDYYTSYFRIELKEKSEKFSSHLDVYK